MGVAVHMVMAGLVMSVAVFVIMATGSMGVAMPSKNDEPDKIGE